MIREKLSFIKALLKRYKNHEVAALGAQMTYYWILSFFPFMIFVISLFSFTPVAQSEFLGYLSTILPKSMYDFIENTVRHLIAYRSETLLSIGAVGAIWTASAGVNVLMRGLNKAYGKKENRPYWRTKPISLFYTIMMGLLIAGSFIMLIFGNALGVYYYIILGVSRFSKVTWNIIRLISPLFPTFVLFIMMYRFVPSHTPRYKQVLPGALFATVSWYFFSYLFSIYVDNFGKYNQMYGSVGGLFFLFTWLYISSVVILLGAEINAEYEKKR